MAENNSLSSLKLTQLNRDNWQGWRKMMNCYLLANELWGIVNGTEAAPGASENEVADYNKRKRRACAVLVSAIHTDLMYLLPEGNELSDPRAIWTALSTHFDHASTYSITQEKRKLLLNTLTDKMDPSDWMKERIIVYQKLQQMGVTVEAGDQVKDTLTMLPTLYQPIECVVTAQIDGGSDITMQALTTLLENFWKKNKPKVAASGEETALFAKPGKGKNFKRRKGKADSVSFQSVAGSFGDLHRQRSSKPKELKCYECGGVGHFRAECPTFLKKKKDPNQAFCVSSYAAVYKIAKNEDVLVDSGASCHMSPRRDCFLELNPLTPPLKVTAAGNHVLLATARGVLNVLVKCSDGSTREIIFNDCLYVPDLDFTLFSVDAALALDSERHFVLHKNGAELWNAEKVLLSATKRNSFYFLNCDLMPVEDNYPENKIQNCVQEQRENTNGSNITSENDKKPPEVTVKCAHERMGHVGVDALLRMFNDDCVKGLNLSNKDMDFCEPCVESKAHQLPFPKHSETKSQHKLELVHSDVIGPMPESIGGAKYAVSFVDDFTHFVWTYSIHKKSDVFQTFKIWLELVENQSNHRLKVFRSDRGGEYESLEFKTFLESRGIIHQTSVADCPQQNGVGERMNRTLMERTRAMKQAAKLPDEFWAEAFNTATYLTNRSPSSVLPTGKTPYEMWWGQKPSIAHVHIFGCLTYAYIPNKFRRKLDPKTEKCVLLGYSTKSKGYQLWSFKRKNLIIRRHVTFNESVFAFEENPDKESTLKQDEQVVDVPVIGEDEHEQFYGDMEDEGEEPGQINPPVLQDAEQHRYPLRENRGVPPARYGHLLDADEIGNIGVFHTSSDEPKNFQEALKSPEREKWMKAAEAEMQSLRQHNTWKLVEPPPGKKIIGNRMIFKVKLDENGLVERYKARLVAQGFSQVFGEDYNQVFAPVVRWESVRALISMATQLNMQIHQMDVNVAFLNGILKEDIYMQQPDRFVEKGKEHLVCKLERSIYGLKQSPRCWNEVLDEHLQSMGFQKSAADECIYTGKINGDLVLLAVYVDDIILASKKEQTINKTKEVFAKRFAVKDMGPLHYFLGVRVVQNQHSVWLGQDKYAREILDRFNMKDCKPMSTPMEASAKPQRATEDSEKFDKRIYQSAIGSLLYIANATRPDLSQAVNRMASYCNEPTSVHWRMVKRIMRYLKGTINLGIMYQREINPELVAYSDSDYAGDIDTRRSTSGYVSLKNGAPIAWKSKKQEIVAQSTAEAEYVALFYATQDVIWIRNLLKELGEKDQKATIIFEDNQASIKISENPVHHPRTKHISTKYHFTREMIKNGQVKLQFCPTEVMIADVLTKPLARDRFQRLTKAIGMVVEPA